MKTRKYITRTAILLFITLSINSIAQDKYFTRDGYISFFSSTPIEDIKAINENVSCIIDGNSGKIEVAVLMKAFQFKKALMEEHFNENYVESGKFPKATFKGELTNMDEINLKKDGTYKAIVIGSLTIHGETTEVKSEGKMEVNDGRVTLTSEFNVSPEDYAIEIPSVVRDKIAKDLVVTFKAELVPFNR